MYEYTVDENQQKNYYFFIDGQNYPHDVRMRFCVERNAILSVELLIACTSVNLVIDCILQGEGADVRIMGAYSVDASHVVKVISMQHHKAAHTRSVMVMKGVLRDSACAHYHGTIRVEKDAHNAYASQENKNIVLSNNARAVSVPNLEVLTHDVKCFHGSAVSRFDKEQLFYAASRGINEIAAQRLLLNAFFANLFTDKMLNNKVTMLIDRN